MKRLRNGSVKKTAFLSAFAIVLNQSVWTVTIYGKELKYEGTTEMSTVDYNLELDGFAAELVVEKVYVEAGEQVKEGDQILKLTEESCQEALNYYEAAVLRAENTLTDAQREYEQGILEAKSEYEMTKTEAEQAEFVREYQEQELSDTIAAYEEIQPEIEEKISEVQNGIENGSYSSQASPGGGSFGGGSGGGTGGSMDSFEKPETEKNSGTEGEAPEKEIEETEKPETEPGTDETEKPETEAPEAGADETETPETETPETEKPETGTDENGLSGNETQDDTEEFQQQAESLKEQIASSTGNYQEILEQIETFLNMEGEADSSENGETGGAGENELASSLRTSIEVDSTISQHMKNVREMANNIPDAVTEALELAGIEYESYIALLDECIAQMESGLTLQKNVLAALEENDNNSETINTETVKSLLEELGNAWESTTDLYSQLSALQEGQISKQEEEIKELQKQIDDLKKQQEEQQEGQEEEQDEEQQEGQEEEQQQNQPGSESFTDGTDGEKESGDGEFTMSGSALSDENAGTGAFAGGAGSIGGSMGSMGGETLGDVSSGISIDGKGDETLTMEDLNLTEEDISLFGNTYDLSQVESLLDQEPADSESAENLLDQLEEAKKTVSSQYEELTREQKATELGIQYTYETSVLNGELAEITYEQELAQWEESLAETKNAKEEMEEKKAILDQMTDGIITADTEGTISAVNYEEDDVLDNTVPLLRFYDTEQVFITISVPQEDIALMQVGDTVEVSVGGRQEMSGKITEKAMEEQEGNSRTTVNYEVTVTVENEDGRLSAGSSASVTAETSSKETEALEEDSKNE